MTNFPVGQNNVSTKIGPLGYTAGSGTLTLQPGGGAQFPALSAGQYLKITVATAGYAYLPSMDLTMYTIFRVTGIIGDVLTLAGVLENTTDRNYVAGDVVEMRSTAGHWNAMNAAVNACENMNAFLYTYCGGL